LTVRRRPENAPSPGLDDDGAALGDIGHDGPVTKKQPKEHLVEPSDLEWISEEIATEVLKRAADGSKPIPWSQVKAELDEMDRLGI
jgi:hypothetical protein